MYNPRDSQMQKEITRPNNSHGTFTFDFFRKSSSGEETGRWREITCLWYLYSKAAPELNLSMI